MFSALPQRHLIVGVPFINWAEAARLAYPDKRTVNPSSAASTGMVVKYWQDEQLRFQSFEGEISGPPETWAFSDGDATSLKTIQQFIAQDLPVIVSAGLTPAAHPIQTLFFHLGMDPEIGFLSGELGANPYSGMLGKMASYKAIERLEARDTGIILGETLYAAIRVVIGYDESSRMVTLHDPSFGPAWEVGYEEFENMWAPMGRPYSVMRPPNHKQLLADSGPSDPYRARAPNERAAEQCLFGYAHSCIGRDADLDKAEDHFTRGLAISGIGRGYEHLFLVEQASIHSRRSNYTKAVELLNGAVAVLPEHHLPWQVLAEIYEQGLLQRSLARQARRKVEELWDDSAARQVVAETLPCDFWIEYLAPIRRWCF